MPKNRDKEENYNILSEINYKLLEEKIRIVSPEKITEIDNYFNLTRVLDKDEHQIWRVIKKCIPVIYKRLTNEIHQTFDGAETRAWLGLDCCAKKGIPTPITCELILAAD